MRKVIYLIFIPIIIVVIFLFSYPNYLYEKSYNNNVFDGSNYNLLNRNYSFEEELSLNNTSWNRMYVLPDHPEGISKQTIIFFNDSLMLQNQYLAKFSTIFSIKYFLGMEDYDSFHTKLFKVRGDSVFAVYKNIKTPGRHFVHKNNRIIIEKID